VVAAPSYRRTEMGKEGFRRSLSNKSAGIPQGLDMRSEKGVGNYS
jgi:hypothetical protein